MDTARAPLRFGVDGEFSPSVDEDRLIGRFAPPEGIEDFQGAVRDAVAAPTDFPPLHQILVPGDRVVLVLDRGTPRAAELLAGLWGELEKREIAAEDVTILQPADHSAAVPPDPRGMLPKEIGKKVVWKIHNPLNETSCHYLATTAGGERIYLAQELVDADAVILLGRVEYDRLLGYRGLETALYPGLSTIEALKKAHGQPHDELGYDDSRPLKQLSEEVSWLLGVQFGVAVVPAGQDGASAVHAGRLESVTRQAIADLKQLWTFEPAEQPELVLVAVDADAEGHGWAQVARALQSARSLVARDGRIALLTQLDAPLTDGLQMVRDSRKPRDALRPLREQAPPDLQTATALAQAVEWANVYLLSRLESDLVEELFMVPLEGLDEVQRLIGGDSRCAVIGSGQHVNMVGVPAGAVGGV